MIEFHAAIFASFSCLSDRIPVAYHLERGGMSLLAVGVNRARLLKIRAQVHSVWPNVCMLDDCVGVIRLDMTTPP